MKRYLLLITSILLISTCCSAQTWSGVGVGLGEPVNAMAVYNGQLYAAGSFTADGVGNNIQHVARWNGSSWTSVGSGLTGDVNALAVFSGDLYATGIFVMSGATTVNHIAKWNGTTWSAVGGGLDNFGTCMHVYGSDLYVGGAFTIANSTVTVNRIAKWNGTSWSALGSGITGGIVNCIGDYSGEVYVGGTFLGAVSKFNGTSWSTVGSINAFDISSLQAWGPNGATSGGNYFLYACGDISSPSQGMLRWNGSSWLSAVQQFSASPGRPKVFYPTYNYLYVGGDFSIIVSGHTVKSVAKFNGSFWDSTGTGMDAAVNALTVYNGNLYAGGDFLNAESNSAKYVARRNVLVGIEEMNSPVIAKNFFPNPLMTEALLSIDISALIEQPELKIVDATGRLVNPVTELLYFNKFNHEIEYRIERSELAEGIYFYQLLDGQKSITTGKFIVK
jgi:hypothetical protein